MILDSSDPSAQHTSTEGNVPQAPPAYFQFQPPNGAPPSNYYASGSPQDSEKSSEKAPPYSQDPQPYTTGGGYLRASSSRQAPYPSPPVGQTSPGQSSSGSSGGFMSRLTGSQPSDLLNPPPPSFSRPPQQNFPYTPFHTVVHISLGATLDKGFPMMPPPAVGGQPHPFMTHDVNEEDWTRLLGDLKRAGTLSPMNKILAGVAPMVILPGIGFVGGFMLSRLFEKRMTSKKTGPTSQLVDHWNHYFFHPRMMEVSLCRGRKKYSGDDDGPPPDMPVVDPHNPHHAHQSGGYTSDSSSSSSSSANSMHGRRGDRREQRRERKEERRKRREEKRERRRERREDKRERRKERREVKDKPWRLVITFRPPPGAPFAMSV